MGFANSRSLLFLAEVVSLARWGSEAGPISGGKEKKWKYSSTFGVKKGVQEKERGKYPSSGESQKNLSKFQKRRN